VDITLKPIDEQVVVITGASSGIGLVTAKTIARQGACVVLAARNERDLARAVEAIRSSGGRAAYQVADVADMSQVERIADTAIREFGRVDTWVNNAGVAVYGRLTQVSLDDMRRQFDVNYWGQVHGSLAAVPLLRERGGALINVASALADRAIPLQGNYCAAKHALKAFTDSLRMELEEEGVPISVTLVKPGSIDTPLFDKSKSYIGVEPQPVPPVYAPEVVAETLIHCAQHPTRDVITGGRGKMLSVANDFPRLADRYMERTTFDSQKTAKPLGDRPSNLYEPVAEDGGERGKNWTGRTKSTSLYTKATLHPEIAATAAALGLGLLARVLGRSAAARSGRRVHEAEPSGDTAPGSQLSGADRVPPPKPAQPDVPED
jgi:NAD(P)-dependent dehydrogenase (short-subunit alcohol dehydrogenase family)